MSRHNSSSSGSSSYLRPIQSSYVCSCGVVAVVHTVKAGPNIGRRFHGCPLWPVSCLVLECSQIMEFVMYLFLYN
ncbi:DNA topoisomerase 3-alpha [Bienertia sinuspersici]